MLRLEPQEAETVRHAMQTSRYSPGTQFYGRLFAHVSRLMAFALCKMLLLVVLLPVSAEAEGKSSEAQEIKVSIESEGLDRRDGVRRRVQTTGALSTNVSQVWRSGQLSASYTQYSPRGLGHRLGNGLLAPMTC